MRRIERIILKHQISAAVRQRTENLHGSVIRDPRLDAGTWIPQACVRPLLRQSRIEHDLREAA